MRSTKLLGLLLVGLALILIVLPATMPATVVHEGGLQFQAREDGCGVAAVAALKHPDKPCGQAAKDRLLLTTTGGVVVLVAGIVLANDQNTRYRSRVQVGH